MKKLRCQEPVSLYLQSGSRKLARKAGTQLSFSFFTQPELQPGSGAAHSKGGSSSPVQLFWKQSLDWYPEVSLHGDS